MHRWLLVIAVLAGAVSGATAADVSGRAAAASPQVRTAPVRHPHGIWKAAVPGAHVDAEFDGHDPLGLAAGAKIKADCSLNWVDPDTGKLYCFSSATSQSVFQDWPKSNIQAARKAWRGFAHSGS
jgi:hypothetical protein